MIRRALLLALLACATAASAQSPAGPPFQRRVSLHLRDVALRDALDRVAAAGGFRLSYSSDDLPLDRRVTVWRDTSLVGEILAELLRNLPVTPVEVASDRVVLAPRASGVTDPVATVTVLDRVVVTGTVLGGPEAAVPVALDVVRGREIERRSQQTLAAVFDGTVPGVWMWDHGPSSLAASYGSIRGASSFGVSVPKVYVDGIEVANPLLFTQLTPELVERVEVIRGPQGAALYGSDAISGVVNVISRHDVGAAGEGRLSLRSEGGYTAAWPTSSVPVQRHEVAGRFGSNLRSFGVSGGGATTGAYVPSAYSHELRASADARIIGARSTLTATARLHGKNAAVPLSPLLPTLPRFAADSEPQRLRAYTVGSTFSFAPNEIWTLAATGGVDGYSLANTPSSWGPIPFFVDSALRAAGGSAMRATLRGSGIARVGNPEAWAGTVTLALEHSSLRDRTLRATSASGPGPGPAASGYVVDWTANFGFTTQVDMAYRNRAFLTAGIRQERVGLLSGATELALLPMVGATVVRNFGGVTAKARVAYGKGIRAPDASLRARTGEKRRVQNLGLHPEEQSGVEGGVDLFFGDGLQLRVTRFDQVASDLIQTVTLADSSGGPNQPRYWHQLQNVGEISNRGWEAQAAATVAAFTLKGAVTTVDSRVQQLAIGYTGDLRPGDRMLGVPARTLAGTVMWQGRGVLLASTVARASDWVNYDRLRIAECYVAKAACPDAQSLTGPTLRNYWAEYAGNTRLRAIASFDLPRGLTLHLTGDNLLNYQRGEPDSITIVPGRALTVGIRAQF